MIGKLNKVTGSGALHKAADAIAPPLQEHLEKTVGELSPALVQDDDSYQKTVVSPALLVASGAAGGVTSLIPGFKDKFSSAMIHLRDELLIRTETSVALVEDVKDRLPDVLVEGLKK